jgi:hypothetical protein
MAKPSRLGEGVRIPGMPLARRELNYGESDGT